MNKLVLCPLLALVACVDASSDTTFVARTNTGADVDVQLGDHVIAASSQGRHASIMWTDDSAVVSGDETSAVFATADESGWTVQPDDSSLTNYGEILGIAETVALGQGVSLPWRDNVAKASVGACNTTSTWVFNGDCYACYAAANAESRLGDSWVEQSTSCSAGSVWTTCSVTKCRGAEMEESLYY